MNYRKILFNILDRCEAGSLCIEKDDEILAVFGEEESIRNAARIQINSDRFFERLALGSDIGMGESYINGEWDSPDLTKVISWFVNNYQYLSPDKVKYFKPALHKLYEWRERYLHFRNRNTLKQSRRNIEAHYDLGNDFYETFLDESMMYSSAYFINESTTLTEAQFEKIDRLCRKLSLKKGDKILEIGCGWGGFAIHAAKYYGAKVVGLTLSPKQLEYARENARRNGLDGDIEFRLQDYRTISGRFDKVVSIEMLEAVGHTFLPSYFETIDRVLKPDGLACIQVIVSADHRYETYRRHSDFIRRHIFPGSHLPSIKALFDAKPQSADLNLYNLESFGLHYATTLKLWRERFEENWNRIAPLGFDETFRRKWNFYLAYCEAGFEGRHINVAQITMGRMNCPTYNLERESNELYQTTGNPELASA